MPKCVYVQFYDEDVQGTKTPCTWTVGSLAPGVYPIDPDRQDWYVDGDKQNRLGGTPSVSPVTAFRKHCVLLSRPHYWHWGGGPKGGQEHRLDDAVRGNIKVQEGG